MSQLKPQSLTERQWREIDYHQRRARQHNHMAAEPVSFDVVQNTARRPWNAYWSVYDLMMSYDWTGKRVLVPGCGFGDDAVRIAALGAEVEAFDISPDIIEIAQARTRRFNFGNVHFKVMPSEQLDYPGSHFDMVFCLDILHHVDIPATLDEFRRVLKPGGRLIGDELYTHGVIERIFRKNGLVEHVIYPRMVKYIYGSDEPYITADERKIDHRELAMIEAVLKSCRIGYFNIFMSRVLPERSALGARADRAFAQAIGGLGRLFAGRIVFDGEIAK